MSMLIRLQQEPGWPTLHWRWAATPLAWSLLATALLVVATLAGPGPSLSDWLGDPDDATRLVTVRELIAGAPWFDTTLPRIGAPEPLLSHWSRLVDAPLALLIGALSPLLGADRAELATRVLWPALLFLALAYVVAREAQGRAGPLAGAFVLLLVTTSATALAQFRPGRIDHHNAQILCAVAGLIFLARSATDRRSGWIAGALLGAGLAVGYEAIALVVPALALAALMAVWQPRLAPGAARAAAGATAVLFAALALTVPPLRWVDVRCDALALNLPVLAAFATAGLWIACAGSARLPLRLAVLGLGGACGGLLYAAIEPACLAGPFGHVGAALGPVWLDHVLETSSILWLAGNHPAAALAATGFVCAGVAAQLALWRKQPNASTGLSAAFVILAAALGFWQLKLLPYACWLSAMPLAIWAAQLTGTATLSPAIVRFGAVVLLSQATLDAGLGAALSPFRHSPEPSVAAAQSGDPRRPCFRSSNLRPIAALPPGLVLADIDLGPYIVALSPHGVVAAPYHRLEKSILANQSILAGAPALALAQLTALGVDYVVLCAETPRRQSTSEGTSLKARLLGGEALGALHEVPAPAGAAVRVWKVVPAS
jgi:hypothetical protein